MGGDHPVSVDATRVHAHTFIHAPKHAYAYTHRRPRGSTPKKHDCILAHQVSSTDEQLHSLVDAQFAYRFTRHAPSNPRAHAEKGSHHCVAERGSARCTQCTPNPFSAFLSGLNRQTSSSTPHESGGTGKHTRAHAHTMRASQGAYTGRAWGARTRVMAVARFLLYPSSVIDAHRRAPRRVEAAAANLSPALESSFLHHWRLHLSS